MPSISKEEEDKLLDSVQKVAALVEDGSTPNDAVEKVAREQKYAPGAINVLCQGYNTGQQLHQMRDNKSALNKFASFELANPSKVITAIYGTPPKKEAAVDVMRLLAKRRQQLDPNSPTKRAQAQLSPAVSQISPQMQKVASDADNALQRVRAQDNNFREYELAKVAYAEACRVVSKTEDQLKSLFSKLASELFSRDLAEVEAVCTSRFGKLASPIFEHIAALPAFQRRPRAGDNMLIKTAVAFSQAPYATVGGIVDKLNELVHAKDKLHHCKVAADQSSDRLRLPRFTRGESTAKVTIGSKKAGDVDEQPAVGWLFSKESSMIPPAFGIAVGNSFGRTLGEFPRTRDDLVDAEVQKLDDVNHLDELRKIRTSAMLNSMLTDPEDPISGFDPDEVVGAYNEISRLAPQSSTQPAVIRPLLQRRLQGNVQPFEAKEITDIEKGITASRSPQRSILDGVS